MARRLSIGGAVVCAIALVAALPRPAHAQAVKPWAAGVSDDQRATAQRMVDDGNELFLDKNYTGALERYRTGLASWDHPAIRFNIVRCLIQLDRPVEAFENLLLALKYGADPLDESVYAEALDYLKLLEHQIAELDVRCGQPGVAVSLDGQPLLVCPDGHKRRVVPGHHQIVGTQRGYLTRTVDLFLLGGTQKTIDISLVPLAAATRIMHRWPVWVPWVEFGAGLAVAGVGGLIQFEARSEMDGYDHGVTLACSTSSCARSQLDTSLRDKALIANKVAIGVIATGATATAVGAVMLYLNRGKATYNSSVDTSGPTLGFAVHEGGGTLSVVGRF